MSLGKSATDLWGKLVAWLGSLLGDPEVRKALKALLKRLIEIIVDLAFRSAFSGQPA